MVTISDFYRTYWDWFSWRTYYCFYSFLLFSGRFLFIRSIRVDETYEAPAPVSIKGRNLMPWISIATKDYVTWLSFVVNRTFDVFSQIEVRCFSLQLAHALLMRQSEARCSGTVQLKHNFFFQRISLRSGVPLTNSHLLD